jgi:hypothetical protein
MTRGFVFPQHGQTMMPMRIRRKGRRLEKVENLYCTATANNVPTRSNKSLHSRAILITLLISRAWRFRNRMPRAHREIIKRKRRHRGAPKIGSALHP